VISSLRKALVRLPGWVCAALVPLLSVALAAALARTAEHGSDLEGRAAWGVVLVASLLVGGLTGGAVGVCADALRAAREAEARLRTEDGLTGLLLRRRFVAMAEREIELALRSGRALSVALVGVDDFRNVNDAHGLAVGDDVLRAVGTTLRTVLRSTDLACRWGGDAFAILLPDTDAEGAVKACDRVLHALRRVTVRAARADVGCRASAGVADLRPESATVNLLVDRADLAMRSAKHAGKDRVANVLARIAAPERSRVRRVASLAAEARRAG